MQDDEKAVWSVQILPAGGGGRPRDGHAGPAGPGSHRHRHLHHHHQRPPRDVGAGGGRHSDHHVHPHLWLTVGTPLQGAGKGDTIGL